MFFVELDDILKRADLGVVNTGEIRFDEALERRV
jgi:hypothetical protein